MENSSMGENLFAIQVFWPKRVCRYKGKPLFPQNRLTIQIFGRKMVCRDKKNSSRGENLFATQVFGPEMVYRCMRKPLFSQNRLAIQTFGREKVCRGKKNSSVQCTKTRSRHRVFSRKWCVATRKTAQSAKTRSRLINWAELELEDS